MVEGSEAHVVFGFPSIAEEKPEIVRGIVGFIPINVMNNLIASEWPAKSAGHDETMLRHVLPLPGKGRTEGEVAFREQWAGDRHITSRVKFPTVSKWSSGWSGTAGPRKTGPAHTRKSPPGNQGAQMSNGNPSDLAAMDTCDLHQADSALGLFDKREGRPVYRRMLQVGVVSSFIPYMGANVDMTPSLKLSSLDLAGNAFRFGHAECSAIGTRYLNDAMSSLAPHFRPVNGGVEQFEILRRKSHVNTSAIVYHMRTQDTIHLAAGGKGVCPSPPFPLPSPASLDKGD